MGTGHGSATMVDNVRDPGVAGPVTPGAVTPDAGTAGGKGNVLGVLVDLVDYERVTGRVLAAARERHPLSLTALAVHGVMVGVRDPTHRALLNSFDLAVPDGQPVRWALNLLYRADLRDPVSGPDLVPMVLARMARESLPVYLYGGTGQLLDRLSASLPHRFPGLRISGAEPSRFQAVSSGEEVAVADRIRRSGARLLLVGLGCPRQEVFTFRMRQLLDIPVMAVGAAFAYHAGSLRRAPRWMERSGSAWLWRLTQEPARLWRRYLLLNPEYLLRLSAQKMGLWRPGPSPAADQPPATVPI